MIKYARATVGPIQTNCYFVFDDELKAAVIIDPADAPDYLSACLDELGVSLCAILLTHGHFDHIQAVPALKEKYGVPVYVHAADEEQLKEPGMFGMDSVKIILKEDDVRLYGEEVLDFPGMRFKVFHTPGHTKGSVCYYMEDPGILFSGDTMFCHSWGRTDFPGGSEKQIFESIRTKLLPLPEETYVLPGHNEPTSIEEERKVHGYSGQW